MFARAYLSFSLANVPARVLASMLATVLCLWSLAGAAVAQDASVEWFEVDPINSGLGPVPDGIDRETPRSSLESFLITARNGDWDAAAHMLDLSDLPLADQAEEGRERARDFLNLLERKIIIDWYDLPDRPDGMNSRGGAENPMTGVARRSILLWYVDVGDRPVPIRINRLKPGDEAPLWVISRQTVDDLPALGDAYGPSELERMLPVELRKQAFWGLRWWEVIALPLGIIATLLSGWVAYKLLSRGMNRNRRIAPASLLVAVRGPIILLVMTLMMTLITNRLLIFSGRIENVVSPLSILGIVVAILWLLVNAVDALLARLVTFDGAELTPIGEGQERRRDLATKLSAIRRFMLVIVAVGGVGIVLNEASVVQSLGLSLLASAGTATLILAFAARNMLANIMASLQISLNQSARIGDKIVYKGHVCSVERVNFTFVQLRVWTGKRLIVPVSDFVGEAFENWTLQEHLTVFEVYLKLDHRADVEPLRRKYDELLDELGIEGEDNRGVMVTDHDAFGQTVLFLVPTDDPNTGWRISCDIREALLVEARRIDSRAKPVFPDVGPMGEAA